MKGNIKRRIELLESRRGYFEERLRSCSLCPRQCGVDRTKDERGWCGAGALPAVYSVGPHNGEEPPLSGTRGSGTIFFTHCNMHCRYCQNYTFSQLSDDREMSIDELAGQILGLARNGCHNINLVSPTHYVPQIAEALLVAYRSGLSLPIVYNTGGYDSPDIIRNLEGIVDIYMPDMRYSDDAMAVEYSDAPGYVGINRLCVSEMQRQVGDLVLDEEEVAVSGLIIRCLVLPNNISGTGASLEFISHEISGDAYISLMSQYYPVYRARQHAELGKRITNKEYVDVLAVMERLGLGNGWVQAAPIDMNTSFGGHRIQPERHEW